MGKKNSLQDYFSFIAHEPHLRYFALGLVGSLLGMMAAFNLFPENAGLVSVFFISLFIIPFSAFVLEERKIMQQTKSVGLDFKLGKETKQKLNPIRLINAHKPIFRAFVFMFIAVFFMFALTQIMLPEHQAQELFKEQNAIFASQQSRYLEATGDYRYAEMQAEQQREEMKAIFANNFKVFLVALFISLVFFSGVFIIVWNASVWGVIFGLMAVTSSSVSGHNPIAYFLLLFASVLPHMITEALAYFTAAIIGSLLINSLMTNKINSNKFTLVMMDAVILFFFGIIILFAAAYVEVYITPFLMQALLPV